MRLARLGWIALVNVFILAVLLIPIELVFGTWFSEDNFGTLSIHRDVHKYDNIARLYPTEGPILYRRDHWGLRGGHARPSDISVLAIGGSTTNERWIDEGATWTAILERGLRADNCPVVIGNAGHDGHTTAAHIRAFEEWLPKIPGLKPRHVILYVGLNDPGLPPEGVRSLHRFEQETWWRRTVTYIGNNSAIVRAEQTTKGLIAAWRVGAGHFRDAAFADPQWEPMTLNPKLADEWRDRLDTYSQRLARLNRLVRAGGAIPIYVTQTRFDGRRIDGVWRQIIGTEGANHQAVLEMFNRRTLEFCGAGGERCIDLASSLSFAAPDHYDAMHTTPGGSMKIAAFLRPRLRDLICPRGG